MILTALLLALAQTSISRLSNIEKNDKGAFWLPFFLEALSSRRLDNAEQRRTDQDGRFSEGGTETRGSAQKHL